MIRPHYILRSFFPSVTWKVNTQEKILYLTFDDGPIPEVTPQVLAILKEYNAKATFFCIGENVLKHPSIYQRILEEGHRTGNHTQHHYSAWKVNREKYLQDIEEAALVIDSKLFRPPYGKLTPAIINRLKNKYHIILWDVISYDFDASFSAEQVYQNAIKHLRPGSILVFHDSLKAAPSLLEVLPRLMDYFTKNQFSLQCIP